MASARSRAFQCIFIPRSFYSGEPNFDKTDSQKPSLNRYLFEHASSNGLTVPENLRYTKSPKNRLRGRFS